MDTEKQKIWRRDVCTSCVSRQKLQQKTRSARMLSLCTIMCLVAVMYLVIGEEARMREHLRSLRCDAVLMGECDSAVFLAAQSSC